MAKRAYISMVLRRDITVEVMGLERKLPFDWADGMLGMMPVFDSEENARKWSNADITICEIVENEP